MAQLETLFTKEKTKKHPQGIYRDLIIFSSSRKHVEEENQLPCGVLSHHEGFYNFHWASWWHQEEVQTEIVRLGGEIWRVSDFERGEARVGSLEDTKIFYSKLFQRSAPRVGCVGPKPPGIPMQQLFIATVNKSSYLDSDEVTQVINDFVARQTIVGRIRVGFRQASQNVVNRFLS